VVATSPPMLGQMEYDVAGGMGQAKHSTANALGIGGTLGVKFTPAKIVTLGAAWESKSSFQDFKFNVPGGTDKLSFDQPQSFTLGASVSPLETLLIAADVQWINWSATMGDNLPKYTSDTTATGSMPFNMGWSDQLVFKVGAQVTPVRGLDLRLGYNYGKTPLDKTHAFENIAFPAVVEHHITAGVGYQVADRLTVDVSAMYALNAKVSGSNPAKGIASYSTEMSQLDLCAGAAYRF
jgi:long-chain fatty acid transport protein